MNNVNRTLYIPLKGKARSRWLAYYVGMRAAVFDRWVTEQMNADPGGVILHIGCGMDSRCRRVGNPGQQWFDIDFPGVIAERRRYYQEDAWYRMIGADVTEPGWLESLPTGNAIVVMEGVSMYLPPAQLKQTLDRIAAHFGSVHLLMDCYTTFAAKASRYKNPINDVGVTQVWGMDDPQMLAGFVRELEMTPRDLIDQLTGLEREIFRRVFAGGFAWKMYRLYEYRR